MGGETCLFNTNVLDIPLHEGPPRIPLYAKEEEETCLFNTNVLDIP